MMTDMPKVVHVTSVHHPLDTRIFRKECRTLVEAGYDVVLVAPHSRDEIVDGVRIRALPRPTSRVQRMALTTFQACRAARRENAVLYHVHDPELIPVAYVLQRKGQHVIYDMHENVRGALVGKHWIPSALRKLVSSAYCRLERSLLPDIPVIFAESAYAELYPWLRQTAVVLNLPDCRDLRNITAPKHSVYTLGYMGYVSVSRGCKVTLDALRIIAGQGHTMHFECVGPYRQTEKREMEALAQRHHLSNIRFHGRLPQHDGWRLMASCHTGLAVLQPDDNYVRSYPTKMFEYMALGLPVVVSDFPLYRSIVERADCGLCVDPTQPQSLADALLYLSANPATAKEMGANGKVLVDTEMNWETEARKLLQFYDEILI